MATKNGANKTTKTKQELKAERKAIERELQMKESVFEALDDIPAGNLYDLVEDWPRLRKQLAKSLKPSGLDFEPTAKKFDAAVEAWGTLGFAGRHPELTDNIGNLALLRLAGRLGLIDAGASEAAHHSYANSAARSTRCGCRASATRGWSGRKRPGWWRRCWRCGRRSSALRRPACRATDTPSSCPCP